MKRLFIFLLLISGATRSLRAQDSLSHDTLHNEIQVSILPLLQAAMGSFNEQPGLGILYKHVYKGSTWLRLGWSSKRLGGESFGTPTYEIIGFDDSTEIRTYSSYGQYWRNQFHLGVEFKLGNGRVRQYVGGDLIGGWFSQSYVEYQETFKRTQSGNSLYWLPVDNTRQETYRRESKFGFGGISAFYGVQFLLTERLYLTTQFQADMRYIIGTQTEITGGVTGSPINVQVTDFNIPALIGDIAVGYRF